MLPLFKSHFSIGKSILTLEDPNDAREGGKDSIFSICVENNIKNLILVEDSLTGFLRSFKKCQELDLNLIFGLNINICSNLETFDKKSESEDSSKITIFAKNGEGCKLLNKIYSFCHSEGGGVIDYSSLKKFFKKDLISVYIPFYDSFIFNNTMFFKNCIPDFSFFEPTFFIEENDLPFDPLMAAKVSNFCKENQFKSFLAKTILYKNREDFESYQTYKCICNRRYGSRDFGLNNPGLTHCGSKEFCIESFLENEKS